MPSSTDSDVKALRILLVVNQVCLWSCAVIVMGITSYFLSKYGRSGEHIIYQEVIACTCVAFYIAAIILPLMKWYRGQLLFLSVIFSYLWLTALIFNAQDYNWHSCWYGDPFGADCAKKHANEAFTFLAFFFSFTAILIEAWIIREYARSTSTTTTRTPAATNGHTDKETNVTNGHTNEATPVATV